MTRPAFTPTKVDPAVDKNFTILQQILSGQISYDNMGVRVISGTTSATPDSPGLAIHSMSPHPVGWFPLVGDVYVQKIDEKYIDVRSTKPSVNYKIILLAGNSVTTEAVVAVGGDEYQDTIEVINNPTGTIPTTTEEGSGVTSNILSYTTFAAQLPGREYNNIIRIGDYYYVAPITPAGSIYRVNPRTGVSTELALGGSSAVAAFFYDGTFLWCADSLEATASPTVQVFKINLDTFSLSSTVNCTVSTGVGVSSVSCLYIDGSNIYIGCTDRVDSTRPGCVSKCNKTTGGLVTKIKFSAATWGTLATSGARSMLVNPDGTEMYVTTVDAASLSKMRVGVINLASATMTEYTVSTNTRRSGAAAVYYNGSVWIPIQPITNLSNSSQVINEIYPLALMEFNVTTHTFTEHPVITGLQIGNTSLSSNFIRNCILVDDFIYMVTGNTTLGTVIIEYDVLNDTFSNFVAPIEQATAATTLSNMNNILVKDDTAAEGFVIFKQINNSAATQTYPNFEWFEPVFEE